MPQHQYSLSLINHEVNDSVIAQRAKDGYINASALCQAANKRWGHYRENRQTDDFIAALEADTGIPVSDLIQSVKGGNGPQGTWVHPQVAIHLAQWLSPVFAVKVSKWIYEWKSSRGATERSSGLMPYHIRRHMLNLNQVPAGYFSILQEMTFMLIAPLDQYGYELPEKMVPDISMGLFLCKHLRDQLDADTDTLPIYRHHYPDGRIVEAKIYPNEYLAEFRKIIQQEWIPKKAAKYFKDRDPQALPFLDKVILALPGPATAKNSPRLSKKAA